MNEDKIIQKLGEHDKRFDELVTRKEFTDFKHQVPTGQDEILTIVRRLDEERVFTAAWLKRIEQEVEGHKKEISKIKEHLKIS